MIVETVFHSVQNQMDFHLVQIRKKNCHHDHIPFNVKRNGNKVFSVYMAEFSSKSAARFSCLSPASRKEKLQRSGMSFGIMRAYIQAFLEPLKHYSSIVPRVLRCSSIESPYYAKRRELLGKFMSVFSHSGKICRSYTLNLH